MSKEEIEPEAVFMLTKLEIAKEVEQRSQNNKNDKECKTKLKS